jgi:serine/threonine protein kinase
MLEHPSLVKIFALETPRDWLFRVRKAHLLIEYVNGKTLDTVPRVPVPALVQVFERVASAMVHVHRRGVCHADLKPNNIMLSRAGDVRIIDYGLAWVKGEEKGRVQGTPEYMAPEQASKGVVNEQTDIYNLGATMYRMVTFRLPPNPVTGAQSGLSLNSKVWDQLLKPVAEINAGAPPALCDLIHQCLAFHPYKRPERMSEVHATLDLLSRKLVRSPEDRLGALEW